MKARVHVMLKNGVLDPQGEAVKHALAALGFQGVEGVRQGKVIELELADGTRFLMTLNMAIVSGNTFTNLMILITLIILKAVNKSEFSNKVSGTNDTRIRTKSTRFQILLKKAEIDSRANHLKIISATKRTMQKS